MVANHAKTSQKLKNKNLLSTETKYHRMGEKNT